MRSIALAGSLFLMVPACTDDPTGEPLPPPAPRAPVELPADEIAPEDLAALIDELAEDTSNNKKCIVEDGDCVCPAPDEGMKVQDKMCEGNTLTCGKQGFCSYVVDRGVSELEVDAEGVLSLR